jgi:hypothetical protein
MLLGHSWGLDGLRAIGFARLTIRRRRRNSQFGHGMQVTVEAIQATQ